MNLATRKSAPDELSQADKKKVTGDQTVASGKIAQPKPRQRKPSGTAASAKEDANSAAKVQPEKADAHKKSKKKKSGEKVVRHSFTMPASEYDMIAALKKKLDAVGIAVKKSQLLRAGIKELSELSHTDPKKKMSKLFLNI